MIHVYISGALTGAPAHVRPLCEQIARACEYEGWSAYAPHLKTDPNKHREITPFEVYQTDRAEVLRADVVIAYIDAPSFGVGQEIEIARAEGIPVIAWAPESPRVSRIVEGSPNVSIMRYCDLGKVLHAAREAVIAAARTRRQPRPQAQGVEVLPQLRGFFALPEDAWIFKELEARTEKGKRTYGEALGTFNGRSAQRDAEEEALDLLQYAMQALTENDADDEHPERTPAGWERNDLTRLRTIHRMIGDVLSAAEE